MYVKGKTSTKRGRNLSFFEHTKVHVAYKNMKMRDFGCQIPKYLRKRCIVKSFLQEKYPSKKLYNYVKLHQEIKMLLRLMT